VHGTQLALFDYGGAATTIAALLVLTLLVDLTSAGLAARCAER